MCTTSLYVQFSVSVKFKRSRLCTYLRMFVNASRCLWLWYSRCHCWCMLIVVTIYVCMYLLNSCCKCYLVVDGTTLVLTIPLGFSCPNGQWQYYCASPRFAILLSFPFWGLRSRGLTYPRRKRLLLLVMDTQHMWSFKFNPSLSNMKHPPKNLLRLKAINRNPTSY